MNLSLLNKHSIILMALALVANIIFFSCHNPNVYFAITQAHGHVGYSIYKHNSVQLNPLLTEHIEGMMHNEQRLIDFDRVREADFGQPTEPFPINDTIGYGVLLGALWKITDSLKFIDIQILQILIFVLLMPLYYQLALLLFGNTTIAFLCGLAQLSFFPLIAYNVMPVRDIWAYYGLLILGYAFCSYMFGAISLVSSALCAFFFSICLWMRPTLFFALPLLSIYARINNKHKSGWKFLSTFWIISVFFFWLPYMRFNMTHYNRAIVSPAGQSLLEGLGEIPNSWGHKLNDEYVADYIGAKYGLDYGTTAFDDAAMQEFKRCVYEQPMHYAKTLLYRMPDILLPGLQWIFYPKSPYTSCNGYYEKVCKVCSSFEEAILFVIRHVYMRFYVLFAWIGLLVMWRRRQSKAFWFIVACLCAGLTTFPSHIEYRYLVPFYWVMSFPLGNIVYCILKYLRHTGHGKRSLFYF